MENNNKKTLILSIVGILVLVIAVVGVSFAMFSFSGSGTKENVIRTGTITVHFDNDTAGNKITLSNTYPQTDATALASSETNSADFTVEGVWNSNMPLTINYEVGLSDITPTANLTASHVKVQVLKNNTVVTPTDSTTTGVTIANLQSVAGSRGLIDHYYVGNGTLTNDGSTHLTDDWTVKAWVADTYDLPDDAANSTSPEVTGGLKSNNSGALHEKKSASDTLTFRIKVVAQQA